MLAWRFRDRWQALAGQRIGITVVPDATGIAALAALDELKVAAYLFAMELPAVQLKEQALRLGLSHLLHATADESDYEILTLEVAPREPCQESSVTILTSGTEGIPKAARHVWQSLSRPVRTTEQPQCWLLSYRIQLYAGLQVLLQAIWSGGTVVIPRAENSPDEVVELMVSSQVEFASATPSYWRRLVLFADRDRLASVPLRQITLGGEAIDQAILDSLTEIFPKARLAHIYATTELGRCFSVTDRQAGFPASFLDQPTSEGVELRIKDGELQIRSANAMQGYEAAPAESRFDRQGWFGTGDLVDVEGDRVYFAGRRGETINVGGNKVQPLEVESRLRKIDGIADVRVFGKSSSIAGQLVACEFVLAEGYQDAAVRQAISAEVADWQSYQRPRFIRMVTEIGLTSAGKTRRQE